MIHRAFIGAMPMPSVCWHITQTNL